jgi:CRP-like cAMP-binding protein
MIVIAGGVFMQKIIDGSLLSRVGNITIFHNLNDDEKRNLLGICDLLEYYKGDRVISQGEDSSSFFIVLTGTLKVTVKDPSGAEIFLSYIQEGDFFGETGIFSDSKRTANVSPVDTSRILSIGKNDFFRFIHMYPHAGVKILMLFVMGLMKKLNETNQGLMAMEKRTVVSQNEVNHLFNEGKK